MSTTIDQSTALELTGPRNTAVMPGFSNADGWALAQRVAKAFSSSSLVPEIYRGPDGMANCLIALEMANRMGASPLLVMQNLYVVHGNPSWSAKFLIATFNQNGRFSALRYEFNQAKTECRAWANEKATNERLEGPLVSIEMAKAEGWSTKNGSKWKTMPELMLMYRAAAFFVRTYAPELSMGLQTTDEIDDVYSEPASGLSAVRAALDGGAVDQGTGEITMPKPAAKTYAEFADDINNADDRALAEIVLQTARETLAPELLDELQNVFARAWQ